MRRQLRAAVLVGLLLAGSGADTAWAAKKDKGPARARVLPARAAAAGLRGAIPPDLKPPPVAIGSKPVVLLPDLNAPRAPALRRLGQGETTLASTGLIGLRSRADATPLCRSACAQTRYRCLAGDGATNCDGTWSQCVLTCRQPLPN